MASSAGPDQRCLELVHLYPLQVREDPLSNLVQGVPPAAGLSCSEAKTLFAMDAAGRC